MSNLRSDEAAPGAIPWNAELSRDAAALVRRLGADGVDWLDGFLAEYVFDGEPLDMVMVKARELAGLAARPRGVFTDD